MSQSESDSNSSIGWEQAGTDEHLATETHFHHDSDTGSGSLEVRCPNCHVPMDVAVDTSLTDLICSACGSHFSLIDQSQATHLAPTLSRMGRFELVERIGIGGFGSVWKARDKQLDRTVAIKIPRQGAMTAEQQEKFFREARAAAQLKHPGIVSVHEVGREGDTVYIVSDFVRGVTLGDWLTGQQLTNRESAELCAKIADALHHAHEHGVIHRDLKPANIMIDGDALPHLMDFGLARRDAGEVTMTIEGQILGTPAYMSPEQAAGEGHTADRRSDVYSLGVILFQLLTGELPFRGNARMLVHQVINEPAPSPRRFNANVARDLETITLRCLEKGPAQRYQTAAEVGDELRRFLSGKPILARPIGSVERAWRWCKRNRTVATLSIFLLLLLTTISTIAPLVAARQASLRRDAQSAELRAIESADRAEREASTAKVLADVAGAKYALTQGLVGDAYVQIAAAIKSQPALEYGRILESIVDSARRDWQLLQRIPQSQEIQWGCFVGPGPKWFVMADQDSIEVRVLNRLDPLTTKALSQPAHAPSAVGEDRLALATAPGVVTLFALPNLETIAECQIPGEVVEIRTDAEGEVIAVLNRAGRARIFDRAGKVLAEHQFQPADVDFVAQPALDVSPSGRLVSFDAGHYAQPKMLWNWRDDVVTPFEVEANQMRFDSDERAYGFLQTVDYVELIEYDLNEKSTSTESLGTGFLYTYGADLEGFGVGRADDRFAVLCDFALHLVRTDETNPRYVQDRRMTTTRFTSLWPQGSDPPKLLAHDRATHSIALDTGSEVVVFANWLPGRAAKSDTTTSFQTDWRMLATAGNKIFTAEYLSLFTRDMLTNESRQFQLVRPRIDEQENMDVRRIAVTPDQSKLAVLWQESMGGKYLRKVVQIFALPTAGSEISLQREFELTANFGGIYYLTGELLLSTDGRVVAWCDHDGKIVGYDVETGSEIYATEVAGSPSYALCESKAFVGVGNYRKADQYLVWDVAAGRAVCRIDLDQPVTRAAFAPEGDSIYIGLASKVLRHHRLPCGELISEVKSPAAPVAMSPKLDRYVGFVVDADRVGSTVLADPLSGRVLEVIQPKSFLLNDAAFATDGSAIALVLESSDGMVLKTPEVANAIRRLEQIAIESDLASQCDDILQYRSRLADTYGRDAKSASSGYRKSMNAAQSLVDDFPARRDLQDQFARSIDVYAQQLLIDLKNEPESSEIVLDQLESLLKHRQELITRFPEVAAYQRDFENLKTRVAAARTKSAHSTNEDEASGDN